MANTPPPNPGQGPDLSGLQTLTQNSQAYLTSLTEWSIGQGDYSAGVDALETSFNGNVNKPGKIQAPQ